MTGTWLKVAETSAARIYTLVVGIISLFLTARMLGPEGRGMLAAAGAWVGLFATLAGLSLGQVVQFRVQRRKIEDWLPGSLGLLLMCAGGLSLLAYFFAVLAHFSSTTEIFKDIPLPLLVLAFAMLPLMIWEEYGSSLLIAAGRLQAYNQAQFVGRTTWLAVLVVLIVLFHTGVVGALYAQLSGQVVVGLISLLVLWRAAGRSVHFNCNGLGEVLKGSARLHLNTVGSFLLAQTSVLMLNQFVTKAEVGHYQLAYQMMAILLIVPQAVSMVLFSRMSEVGPDSLWTDQKRIALQTAVVMLLLIAMAYLLVPKLIPLMAGPGFEPSIAIFQLLLPNLVGLTFAQIMTCQWIGRGIFMLTALCTFGVAAANVVANAVLIPRYGISGAIWSGWVCYLGITVIVQGGFAWWCERQYRCSKICRSKD